MRRAGAVVLSAAALAIAGALGIAALNGLDSSALGRGPDRIALEYFPHDRAIANPERGLFEVHYSDTLSRGYRPLARTSLEKARAEGSTLVRRYFLLSDYLQSDIADDYLAAVSADFEMARQAGVKLIVRFSYTNDERARMRDATLERILRHIEQLTPVLRENSDVIAVVEAGFIGVWGEWAFTSNFSDPYDVAYADRQRVLEALLQVLPADRFVQVRTPRYKYRIALAPAEAARVGFYNDCFLNGDTDGGTYLKDQVAAERAYLAAETDRVPVGGETCSEPRERFEQALDDFALFNWSYLDGNFHPGHWNRWRREGTADEIVRRLGYRMELVRGEYSTHARAGETLAVDVALRNSGWAAPFNPRAIEVILRGTDGALYRLGVNAEARRWGPGRFHSIGGELQLPADLPPGAYELLLHLADPAPALYGRPEFAMQLANEGTWEPDTGFNRLFHTVIVE